MHVTSVITAYIVFVCDGDNQTMATEELVSTLAKPVPEYATLKEGLQRGIDCKDESLLGHLITC